MDLPKEFGVTRKAPLLFFPGSTIGNQTPREAGQFLGRVRNLLGVNGSILIGVDLKKDKNILNRAYDDAEGLTAAFNLNLLKRMKNELKAQSRDQCSTSDVGWRHDDDHRPSVRIQHGRTHCTRQRQRDSRGRTSQDL